MDSIDTIDIDRIKKLISQCEIQTLSECYYFLSMPDGNCLGTLGQIMYNKTLPELKKILQVQDINKPENAIALRIPCINTEFNNEFINEYCFETEDMSIYPNVEYSQEQNTQTFEQSLQLFQEWLNKDSHYHSVYFFCPIILTNINQNTGHAGMIIYIQGPERPTKMSIAYRLQMAHGAEACAFIGYITDMDMLLELEYPDVIEGKLQKMDVKEVQDTTLEIYHSFIDYDNQYYVEIGVHIASKRNLCSHITTFIRESYREYYEDFMNPIFTTLQLVNWFNSMIISPSAANVWDAYIEDVTSPIDTIEDNVATIARLNGQDQDHIMIPIVGVYYSQTYNGDPRYILGGSGNWLPSGMGCDKLIQYVEKVLKDQEVHELQYMNPDLLDGLKTTLMGCKAWIKTLDHKVFINQPTELIEEFKQISLLERGTNDDSIVLRKKNYRKPRSRSAAKEEVDSTRPKQANKITYRSKNAVYRVKQSPNVSVQESSIQSFQNDNSSHSILRDEQLDLQEHYSRASNDTETKYSFYVKDQTQWMDPAYKPVRDLFQTTQLTKLEVAILSVAFNKEQYDQILAPFKEQPLMQFKVKCIAPKDKQLLRPNITPLQFKSEAVIRKYLVDEGYENIQIIKTAQTSGMARLENDSLVEVYKPIIKSRLSLSNSRRLAGHAMFRIISDAYEVYAINQLISKGAENILYLSPKPSTLRIRQQHQNKSKKIGAQDPTIYGIRKRLYEYDEEIYQRTKGQDFQFMNWVDKEDDMETAIYDLMLETKTDSIIMPDVIYYENYMKDLGAAINRYQDVTDIKVNVISVHNVYNYEKNQTIPDGTGRPAITWVCVNGVWQYKPNDNSNDYRHGKQKGCDKCKFQVVGGLYSYNVKHKTGIIPNMATVIAEVTFNKIQTNQEQQVTCTCTEHTTDYQYAQELKQAYKQYLLPNTYLPYNRFVTKIQQYKDTQLVQQVASLNPQDTFKKFDNDFEKIRDIILQKPYLQQLTNDDKYLKQVAKKAADMAVDDSGLVMMEFERWLYNTIPKHLNAIVVELVHFIIKLVQDIFQAQATTLSSLKSMLKQLFCFGSFREKLSGMWSKVKETFLNAYGVVRGFVQYHIFRKIYNAYRAVIDTTTQYMRQFYRFMARFIDILFQDPIESIQYVQAVLFNKVWVTPKVDPRLITERSESMPEKIRYRYYIIATHYRQYSLMFNTFEQYSGFVKAHLEALGPVTFSQAQYDVWKILKTINEYGPEQVQTITSQISSTGVDDKVLKIMRVQKLTRMGQTYRELQVQTWYNPKIVAYKTKILATLAYNMILNDRVPTFELDPRMLSVHKSSRVKDRMLRFKDNIVDVSVLNPHLSMMAQFIIDPISVLKISLIDRVKSQWLKALLCMYSVFNQCIRVYLSFVKDGFVRLFILATPLPFQIFYLIFQYIGYLATSLKGIYGYIVALFMANHRGLYIPYFSLTNWISDHTDCVDFAKILNDLHYVASKCFYDAEDFKAGMLSYCIDEVSSLAVVKQPIKILYSVQRLFQRHKPPKVQSDTMPLLSLENNQWVESERTQEVHLKTMQTKLQQEMQAIHEAKELEMFEKISAQEKSLEINRPKNLPESEIEDPPAFEGYPKLQEAWVASGKGRRTIDLGSFRVQKQKVKCQQPGLHQFEHDITNDPETEKIFNNLLRNGAVFRETQGYVVQDWQQWSNVVARIDDQLGDLANQNLYYAPSANDRAEHLQVPKNTYQNLVTAVFKRQFKQLDMLEEFQNRPGHRQFCRFLKDKVDTMLELTRSDWQGQEYTCEQLGIQYIEQLSDSSKKALYRSSFNRLKKDLIGDGVRKITPQLKMQETHFKEYQDDILQIPDPRAISPIYSRYDFASNLSGYLLKKFLPPDSMGMGINMFQTREMIQEKLSGFQQPLLISSDISRCDSHITALEKKNCCYYALGKILEQLQFENEVFRQNVLHFQKNQAKIIQLRLRPNHFRKMYGFDTDKRNGPVLMEYTTQHTTFSGVALETSWNNTVVVAAAMQYILQHANITKYEVVTAGDDTFVVIERGNIQMFKSSMMQYTGTTPTSHIPFKIKCHVSNMYSDFLSKHIQFRDGQVSICRMWNRLVINGFIQFSDKMVYEAHQTAVIQCLKECITLPGLLLDLKAMRESAIDFDKFSKKWQQKIDHVVQTKMQKKWGQKNIDTKHMEQVGVQDQYALQPLPDKYEIGQLVNNYTVYKQDGYVTDEIGQQIDDKLSIISYSDRKHIKGYAKRWVQSQRNLQNYLQILDNLHEKTIKNKQRRLNEYGSYHVREYQKGQEEARIQQNIDMKKKNNATKPPAQRQNKSLKNARKRIQRLKKSAQPRETVVITNTNVPKQTRPRMSGNNSQISRMADITNRNEIKLSYQYMCSLLNPLQYSHRGITSGLTLTGLIATRQEFGLDMQDQEISARIELYPIPTAISCLIRYYDNNYVSTSQQTNRVVSFQGPLSGQTIASDHRVVGLKVKFVNNTPVIEHAGQMGLTYAYDADAVPATYDRVVQSYHYTTFKPNDTPSINFYPVTGSEVSLSTVNREDRALGIIINAVPGRCQYTIQLEWLIEYIPSADIAWLIQLGRPMVPPQALNIVQDLLASNKKLFIDLDERQIARSHKLAKLAGVSSRILSTAVSSAFANSQNITKVTHQDVKRLKPTLEDNTELIEAVDKNGNNKPIRQKIAKHDYHMHSQDSMMSRALHEVEDKFIDVADDIVDLVKDTTKQRFTSVIVDGIERLVPILL